MPSFGGFEANYHLYNTPRAVEAYARMAGLSRGEKAILRRLERRLPTMDMLDIGVGGGRTTGPFAKLARRYIGIDFAPAMVEACRAKLRDVEFRVADARDLSMFPGGSFDFALFSFNGIDCLAYDDRSRVFSEIHRVLRPGGLMAFSSHNAAFLDPMTVGGACRLALRPGTSLRVVVRKLAFWRKLESLKRIEGKSHVVVFERQHGLSVPIVYARPDCQVQALLHHGFLVQATISNATGESLDRPDHILRGSDAWLYYLAEKPRE